MNVVCMLGSGRSNGAMLLSRSTRYRTSGAARTATVSRAAIMDPASTRERAKPGLWSSVRATGASYGSQAPPPHARADAGSVRGRRERLAWQMQRGGQPDEHDHVDHAIVGCDDVVANRFGAQPVGP